MIRSFLSMQFNQWAHSLWKGRRLPTVLGWLQARCALFYVFILDYIDFSEEKQERFAPCIQP